MSPRPTFARLIALAAKSRRTETRLHISSAALVPFALMVISFVGSAGGQETGRREPFDERRTAHHEFTKSWVDLANVSWDHTADFRKAAEGLERAADVLEARLGADSPQVKGTRERARTFAAIGELPAEKRDLYRQAFDTRNSAYALVARGDRARAALALRKSQEQLEAAVGAEDGLLVYNLPHITQSEVNIGEFRSAKEHAEKYVAITKRDYTKENGIISQALYLLAQSERGLGETAEAEQHLREALTLFEGVVGEREYFTKMYGEVQCFLARLLNDENRHADAEPLAHRASAIAIFSEETGNFIKAQIELARSQSGLKQRAAAEITFKCLMNMIEENWPPPYVVAILTPYAAHLKSIGDQAEADRVEQRVKELRAGK